MDTLDRFLLVAEVKSISGAAKLLRVSQPALSRTIAQLEARFKVELFRRTASGVELTAAGLVLYEGAGSAARALRNAEEEINLIERSEELTLTLCAGDTWGFGILPPVIQRFAKLYPDVDLQLDVQEHDTRMSGLRNGTYEIAFGVISPKYEASPLYAWTPMLSARYGIFCRAGHPLLAMSDVGQAEVSEFPWINHQLEYDIRPVPLRQSGRNYKLRTNTMLNAMQVMRGSDLLISAAEWLKDMFERNGLVYLKEDATSPLFVSGYVYMRRSPLRLPAKRFLTLVVEHCKAWTR